MIKQRRNRWFAAWFCHHARQKLKANFRKCSLTPDSQLPVFEDQVPVVVICNHSSWWDPLLALFLSQYIFNRPLYGVMAEEQLRRYGIFRYVGIYSVDRESNQEGRAFLRYTRDLITGKNCLLWIYPQGELLSNGHPSLEFKKGFVQIMTHLPKVHLLKIVVSYDFWIESKPEIVIDLLPLETLMPRKGSEFVTRLTERVQSEMTERLSEVKRIVRTQDGTPLKPLFLNDGGTHAVYDFYRRLKAFTLRQSFSKRHGTE